MHLASVFWTFVNYISYMRSYMHILCPEMSICAEAESCYGKKCSNVSFRFLDTY